jgi:hypothetical protein
MSAVKSVQEIQLVNPTANPYDVTISSVDTSKSFVAQMSLPQAYTGGSTYTYTAGCTLLNSTTVRFFGGVSFVGQTMAVRIVEFN